MFSKSQATLIFCLLVYTIPSFAQEEIKELPSGYYMTVAAYFSSGEDYAIRYSKKLQAEGFNANYGFTYKKNMFFVYIKHYNEFKVAVSEINNTRENTPFDDAWVYAYEAVNQVKETEEVEKVQKVEKVEVAPSDSTIVVQDTTTVSVRVKTITEEEEASIVEDDGSRIISFEALRARTQEPVDVEITLFDPYDESVITTMKSWESKRVLPPGNNKNIMRARTNTIGWKTDAVSFNFKDPVNDTTDYFVKVSNDTLILFFDMHRLRSGDTQILFNVYFQSESTVMRPVSKLQLQELWNMMDENPNYRIMLHGHTNGNASGNYIRLSANDTTFFKVSSKHEETSGSAKRLSYDRALTVKRYLISRGIAGDRIETKGWGGKKQIYDKNSRAAPRNIRVEVEIIEE